MLDTTGSMAAADRRRQAQDLVDRDVDRRRQSGRRNPHGPGRLSRHRRRVRHQGVRPHHRYPGPLRQSARAARRAAAATGRKASTRRCTSAVDQADLDAGPTTSAASCSWSATRRRTWIIAQDMKYPEVLAIARERDIIVNAVQAGGARDTERVWREIAQMGHGRYIPIPQDGGQIVIIETPYRHRDHRIAGPHQRHGDSVRTAPPALGGAQEDRAGRRGAAIGRLGDGELYSKAQRGSRLRRSRDRRRRSGCRRRRRTAEARRS